MEHKAVRPTETEIPEVLLGAALCRVIVKDAPSRTARFWLPGANSRLG